MAGILCPHCQGPVPPAARLCAHCNGPLFDNGALSREPVCPRCRRKLEAAEMEGGDRAHLCPQCAGLWVDRDDFERSTRPQAVPDRYSRSKEHWHKPGRGAIQYVSCPRCGRYMNRENFSRISGIIVDRCRDHGAWLDAGELERIRLFIASGGLERFQDKRLELIEEKLEAVARQTRQVKFMQDLLHLWNVKRFLFRGELP